MYIFLTTTLKATPASSARIVKLTSPGHEPQPLAFIIRDAPRTSSVLAGPETAVSTTDGAPGRAADAIDEDLASGTAYARVTHLDLAIIATEVLEPIDAMTQHEVRGGRVRIERIAAHVPAFILRSAALSRNALVGIAGAAGVTAHARMGTARTLLLAPRDARLAGGAARLASTGLPALGAAVAVLVEADLVAKATGRRVQRERPGAARYGATGNAPLAALDCRCGCGDRCGGARNAPCSEAPPAG